MTKVLIVDDDKGMCYTLAGMVRQRGHDVTCAYTLKEGLEEVSSGEFDVVFLDVQLPDGSGLEQLPKIMETPSKPEVIIITGQGDPDGAELAIKNGAWDYIEKPSSIEEMTLPFVRALQYREDKKYGKQSVALKREGIIGDSPQIQACLDLLAQAANSDGNVLIGGETGTGKELFARAIHENSSRCSNYYVVVDCAAIPETLVQSTLFGHEKGAFTGAYKAMEGLIKQADGGTLLLDEVGELPLSAQKAFLRVLQEKSFRPVGSKHEIKSNFRVIVSTNRNLEQMVLQGQFRSDLLFRLLTFYIELPPLRMRGEDIKKLAIYHTAKLCEGYAVGTKGFSPEFTKTLNSYSWPGNVRELVNALERVLAASGTEPTLFPKHLPDYIRIKLAREQEFKGSPAKGIQQESTESSQPFPKLRDLREKAIAQLEQQYLTDLISHTKGDIKEAFRISGIGKSRFYELLKKYNIVLSF